MTEPVEVPRISGVKIAQTARGEAQVTVHAYVGVTDEERDAAKEKAIRVYNETVAAVRG